MNDWVDAEGHADRALEWFERGRWAEAEAELRKAISLNPDQGEWHFNLGLTLEAAGRDSEALASYDAAIRLLPEEIEMLMAAGISCNRLLQPERAIERFNEVLQIDRKYEQVYAHLMESYLRLENHDEVETTYYLCQQELAQPAAQVLAVLAESLLQRGSDERAEWCLKQALRLDPTMPRLRAKLATVMARTGRPQRSLQMYLRELRDDPGNIDTLLDYGELLLDLGRLPDASEKFRRVLEQEPANVDAHYHLGRIAMHAHRYEQAYLEFELVMKLEPGFEQIRLDVADALLRRQRLAEARHVLQLELEQLGSHVTPSSGKTPVAGSTPDSSERSSDGASDGPSVQHLQRFGDLLLKAGWNSQAAMVLKRAIQSHGRSVDLYRKLALAQFRAGDRTRGAAASRRAAKLDPQCVRSIHNLALAALEQGQLRIASGWITRGLRVDRHDLGIRRLRMRLYAALIGRGVRSIFRVG